MEAQPLQPALAQAQEALEIALGVVATTHGPAPRGPESGLTEAVAKPADTGGGYHPSDTAGTSYMDEPLRILLLEEDAGETERLTLALQRAGMTAVTERVDARDAFILALRHFAPDVVLSRYSDSTLKAPAALEILRTMRPSAAFIVLADSLEESAVVASLRAGADNIVSRKHPEQLAPAIAAAVALHRPLEQLTPRQVQVLRLIAQGHSTPQIARDLGLSVKTVESHRSQVMKRLGVHDVATLVRYAVRVGLVLSDGVATEWRI